MLRSMYSGISGMKNFQTKLDVIGNNIANVNTFGFKKGRVTFKDAINQMISGASAATANRGGKNCNTSRTWLYNWQQLIRSIQDRVYKQLVVH